MFILLYATRKKPYMFLKVVLSVPSGPPEPAASMEVAAETAGMLPHVQSLISLSGRVSRDMRGRGPRYTHSLSDLTPSAF